MRLIISISVLIKLFQPKYHNTTQLLYSSMPRKSKYADFFACDMFLVVGASDNRAKFGNKVLRCYKQHDRIAIPVNKRLKMIEDVPVVESLTLFRMIIDSDDDDRRSTFGSPLTRDVSKVGVSIITPPDVTNQIIDEAWGQGYRHIFLQPGTYDASTDHMLASDKKYDAMLVKKGCVLVALGFQDSEPY